MATSRDIARDAGVSQSTVSRVLRGDPHVTAATRDRVLEASRSAGYSPNLLARSMRTKRTGCISLVISDITNPLFGQVVRVVERELESQDRTIVLWDEDARDTHAMEDTRLSLVDGLIMAAALPGSRVLEAAMRNKVPVVLINRKPDNLDIDAVLSADYDGGRTAGEYLISCGRRRIALISGPDAATNSRDRAQGFRDALTEAGAELAINLDRSGEISHQHGRTAMLEMLDGNPDLDAVFCISDLIAFGALDGCHAVGRRVPDDVYVLGYNNIEMASWDSFSLTSISHPIERMATEALRLLDRRIADPTAPTEVIRLPNELVVRRSTANTPHA